MKKITTMLALFGLALTVNAQEVEFEVKDAYIQESLSAKSTLGTNLQIEHLPPEGKIYLVVTGVGKSTSGSKSVKAEDIYVLSGDAKVKNCGEIDLDDNLFESGAQSLYARENSQWISFVFMIPKEKQITTMMIEDKKISIGEVGRETKITPAKFTCEVLDKKLVSDVKMSEHYDWNNRDASTYTEKFSNSNGQFLRMRVNMTVAALPPFTTSVYFSAKSYYVELSNGIKLHCLGGSTESDELSAGFSSSTYASDLSTEFYIYIPVGKLSLEDLKGAKLHYINNKVAEL